MKMIAFYPILIGMMLLLAACSVGQPAVETQTISDIYLTPYHTATPTSTITPTPLDQPTQTPKPTITPTPRTYEIHENDTLLSIAYFYGISLEELLAANPDVNPSLLAIGSRLIIPAAREITATAAAPTPTPYAVTRGETSCMTATTGGTHCFVLIENGLDQSVTNLTGEFRLVNEQGEVAFSRIVALPLKQLAPGARLPFYTYFDLAQVENHSVAFELLTASGTGSSDNVIFPLLIETEDTAIIGDGSTAVISGSLALESGDAETNRITLAAVAYDARGNVIGLRRIEEEAAMSTGSSRPFKIEVFSVSGVIATVEVYAEAGN